MKSKAQIKQLYLKCNCIPLLFWLTFERLMLRQILILTSRHRRDSWKCWCTPWWWSSVVSATVKTLLNIRKMWSLSWLSAHSNGGFREDTDFNVNSKLKHNCNPTTLIHEVSPHYARPRRPHVDFRTRQGQSLFRVSKEVCAYTQKRMHTCKRLNLWLAKWQGADNTGLQAICMLLRVKKGHWLVHL